MKLRWDRKTEEAATGGVFLLPGVAVVTLCVFVPLVVAVALSLTHCSRFLNVRWAGLYNYRKLLTDPLALKSLGNTLLYVAVFVPSNLLLALGIAMLLNRSFRGMKVLRGAYFVPVVLSMVVTVSIFRFLYDRNYGPINTVLGTIGFDPVPWLESSNLAMWSIILMALWKSAAFFSIILLAALQDVPKSLQEAAMVDGAGALQRFRNVTVPSIMPVMGSVAILSSLGAFRVFVPMYVLTQGGPAHSTRTLALHAYEAAFTNGQIGYSAAVSFVLMAVIIAVSLVARRLRRADA